MVDIQSSRKDSETSVDWRGKPCMPNKHGGMRAAFFVLGIQAFEIMAIAAVGNNLITYVFNEMHFSLSKSANIVTNFVGTIFLLSLLGGFLSDSYLGSFWTMLIFGFVELSVSHKLTEIFTTRSECSGRRLILEVFSQGFMLLSVQAHLPQLRPPSCSMTSPEEHCEEAKGFKATVFFVALYLVALGSGCLKPNMISHGADQFRKDDPVQSKKLSTYFNTAYFSFCVGELIALTLLIWVQTRSGMDVGFGVSAAAMAVGLGIMIAGAAFYRNKRPQGSIFTPIARVLFFFFFSFKSREEDFELKTNLQVLVAAFSKRKQICPSSSEPHAGPCRFLDKACLKSEDDGSNTKESQWRLCTVSEVEQVKILISVVPIFACTIIFNTILAQLQTFSVQQGSAMDTKVSDSFHVPPASLQAIPYIMLIALVPIYETCFVPLARKFTGTGTGITPLQRIGVGLFMVTFSMVAAAVIEKKRRDTYVESDKLLSIFWIAPQFLIFGLSEMFTAVGLIEHFYKQSLAGMQSFLTAMTYCSYSFGFFLSSLLVSLVNNVTATSSTDGWLSDNDLNKDRLDLFYWLLAALSLVNFFIYLLCSNWYSTSSTPPSPSTSTEDDDSHTGFASSKHVRAEEIL